MQQVVISDPSRGQDVEAGVSSDDSSSGISLSKAEDEKLAILAQIDAKACFTFGISTEEAVNVLLKQIKKKEVKMLFPEVDQLLHLQFVYIKPDASSFGHHSKPIVLPHPLHEKGNTTVCLIMRDLDHPLKGKCDHDVDKEAREWVDKLETEYGLTKEHFNKVLTKRQLERVYHSYQERRQLASAYDIFLVDSIVEKSVLRFCGKDFHKAKKVPMRFVVGRHRSLNHQINRSYYTVMFPFSPCRTRISLRIGNLSNPMEHLVENVHVAVESVFKYCPGGFINIQSISLQMVTGGSSLPLYISVGRRNAVKLSRPLKMKDIKAKRDEMAIVGELSTLPEGMEVMVHKDGEVKVLSTKKTKLTTGQKVNDKSKKSNNLRLSVNRRQEKVKKIRMLKEKREQAHKSKEGLLRAAEGHVLTMKGLLKKKRKLSQKQKQKGSIEKS